MYAGLKLISSELSIADLSSTCRISLQWAGHVAILGNRELYTPLKAKRFERRERVLSG
jgi:hypothetical protein